MTMADFKPSRATVSIVGTVGRSESKFDGALTETTIAVNKGYKDKNNNNEWKDTGTDWYTFITRGDWQSVVAGVQPGDRVEVANAKLEHREYPKNDGSTGVAYELTFGEFVVLERKADREPVGASAGSGQTGF